MKKKENEMKEKEKEKKKKEKTEKGKRKKKKKWGGGSPKTIYKNFQTPDRPPLAAATGIKIIIYTENPPGELGSPGT